MTLCSEITYGPTNNEKKKKKPPKNSKPFEGDPFQKLETYTN